MQRFYGGRVSDWLSMPLYELNAFLGLAVQLRAEESVERIADSAAAFGGGKDRVRGLANLARKGPRRVAEENTVDIRGGNVGALEGLGFKVERAS